MKQGGPLLLLLACHLQATNPLTSSSKQSCDKRRESRDSIPTSSQREVTQPLWQSNEKAQLWKWKSTTASKICRSSPIKKNCNI